MNEALLLHEFKRLMKAEQFAVLEEDGVHLEVSIKRGNHTVALFAYNGYYVEVWLNDKTDKLTRVAAFDDAALLDPFLEGIDLVSVYALL